MCGIYHFIVCTSNLVSFLCASPIFHFHLLVNPRRACAGRVTVVGSVCLSVKSHLTYGASVHPENAVTYSAGNEGPNICGVFSETAPLQRSSTPSVVRLMRSRPFLSVRKMRMRMSSPAVH